MKPMKVRIDIDTKTFVRFWLVVIGFAFAILAVYSAINALIIIGTALFLALALNKPVNKLASFLPGQSRVGGTAIAFIIVVLLIGAVIFLVVPPIIQQSARFIGTVPTLIDNASEHWDGLSHLVAKYHLESQVNDAIESIKSSSTSWAASIGSNFVSSVGSLFGLVASTILVLVLAFLMLVEAPLWLQRVWSVYNDPQRMQHHHDIAKKMYNVVTGYVSGQLAVSSIGAAFAGVTVFILSLIFPAVPANLALPSVAITFLLSLIPMFGATIGGTLITVLLAMNDITAAIIFVVYFIIYQQIENNFIAPTVQAKAVELSALAILISVTIGLYVFGLPGGIISIPIAGCIKVLLEDYLQRKRETRESKKPLHKLIKRT